nr:hypothetical protein [Candidatus Sigynarchaeota archaeon]
MTTIPSHGMSLAYHNKAMDVSSLSINVNEELVTVNDEKRSEFINLQYKFLTDTDAALKRYAHVALNRVTLSMYEPAQFFKETAPNPTGQVVFFPLKVADDSFVCTIGSRDTTRLDFRKMIPTIEQIQAWLDEVRKVTLVRGINFVQQDQVVQRYANRFLQRAETDFAGSGWILEKTQPSQPSTIVDIDLPPVQERPEYLKIATFRLPWRVNFANHEFSVLCDDVSQELEKLDMIEDEYLVEFNKFCVPVPLVPRLFDVALGHVKALWNDLAPVFVPAWRQKLAKTIVDRVLDDVDMTGFSTGSSPASIDSELTGKFAIFTNKFEEYTAGLETKFKDLGSQVIDERMFNAVLEGYKGVVGSATALEDLVPAIKAAWVDAQKSAIAPGMEHDAALAEAAMAHVKRSITGLSPAMVSSTLECIEMALLTKFTAALQERLINDILQSEKGIVKNLGTAIIKKMSTDLLIRLVKRLSDAGQPSGEPLVDPAIVKDTCKAALQSSTAGFKLGIDELIQFAAELLDAKLQDAIAPHMQKFLALKRDVLFLKEYVLRSDVLNKYLEKHSEHFYDPKSFAKGLADFVANDLSQLPVEWGSLLTNWFVAFTNVFQLQHAQKPLLRSEIVQKFFDFIKIVADEQNTFENTFAIISSYVGSLTDSKDKKALLEFLKRFEQSQGVQEKFVTHFEGRVLKALDAIKLTDLEAKLGRDEATPAIVKAVVNDVSWIVPGAIAIPSEIVFHFERDAKIEFKVEVDVAADGMTLVLLTNWFKLVEA